MENLEKICWFASFLKEKQKKRAEKIKKQTFAHNNSLLLLFFCVFLFLILIPYRLQNAIL